MHGEDRRFIWTRSLRDADSTDDIQQQKLIFDHLTLYPLPAWVCMLDAGSDAEQYGLSPPQPSVTFIIHTRWVRFNMGRKRYQTPFIRSNQTESSCSPDPEFLQRTAHQKAPVITFSNRMLGSEIGYGKDCASHARRVYLSLYKVFYDWRRWL